MSAQEPCYVITGGRPLRGAVAVSGSKNAALYALAAGLLASDTLTLTNVPRIADIEEMAEILRALGARVEIEGETVRIATPAVASTAPPAELVVRLRASFLVMGPLLARCGEAELTPPGGDVIGRRRLDTHFLALEQLGAVHEFGDRIRFTTKGLVGADIFLDEPSVTGTENAIMAAVAAKGTTVLHNAACEPHVQDLANFLVTLGAQIDGIGTNRLIIDGDQVVQPFSATATHSAEFMGLPASGRKFKIEGARLHVMKDGRIQEEQRIYDFTGLLIQVGVLKSKPAV